MIAEIGDASWRAALAEAPRLSLSQSPGWGDLMAARGRIVTRFHWQGRAFGQLIERRFGPVRLGILARGPAWLDAPDWAGFAAALRQFRRRERWQFCLFSPDCDQDIARDLRAAGLRRVMTGTSTVRVDLSPGEADLRRKLRPSWAASLRKAEQGGVTVRPASADDLGWLIAQDRGHQKTAGYGADSAAALALAPDHGCTLIARHANKRIAGALFLRHGPGATYQIGWSGPDGRRLGAANLLLWQALLRLREAGIRQLDLGGVWAGAPGITRFKQGLGGDLVTLPGTFL